MSALFLKKHFIYQYVFSVLLAKYFINNLKRGIRAHFTLYFKGWMSAKKDEENLLATIIFCFSRLQLNMRHFRIERVQKNISASKQYTLKYSKNICICYLFTLFLSFSNSLQYCNFWLLSFSLLSNSLVLLLASTFFSYPFFL